MFSYMLLRKEIPLWNKVKYFVLLIYFCVTNFSKILWLKATDRQATRQICSLIWRLDLGRIHFEAHSPNFWQASFLHQWWTIDIDFLLAFGQRSLSIPSHVDMAARIVSWHGCRLPPKQAIHKREKTYTQDFNLISEMTNYNFYFILLIITELVIPSLSWGENYASMLILGGWNHWGSI